MITFFVIGAAGMLLLLISLPLGDIFDFGDGALSGTSLGAGAVAFGAIGAIVTANGFPTGWAYLASAVVAVIAVIGVQRVIKQLRDTEDGQPRTLTGGGGVVTSTITPNSNGEVSLDDPHEVERRLAWADVTIPSGARIVVVEQSGSRVKVAPAPSTTPPIHDV